MSCQSSQGNGSGHLLWIDATPNDPVLKAKEQKKVRAHARKATARKFHETHKVGGINQSQQQLALAPRTTAYNSQSQTCQNTDCSLHFSQCSAKLAELKHTMQQSSIRNYGSRTVDSPISDISEDEATNQHRCRACGQHMTIEVSRDMQGYGPSLVNAFLGAGRVDPFSSYPIKNSKPYLHQLVDYAVTCQIPGLLPGLFIDDDSSTPINVAHEWLSNSLKHPVLFHALLFGSSVHLDFQRWSKFYPTSPRALVHKMAIIHHLKEVMAKPNPKQSYSDEVILSILTLASHEPLEYPRSKNNPFRPPLRDAQWANIYGSLRYPPEHMKAMLDLITLRGGLENLKMPGLAQIIYTGDIVSATNSASKPIYAELKQGERSLSKLRNWAVTAPPRILFRTQPATGGFRGLERLGLTERMLDLFDAVSAITLAFKCHLEGNLVGLRLGAVIITRHVVQHRLLSLPTRKEFEQLDVKQIDPAKLSFYECCRLSALIYGIGVVHPIPNNYPVFCELVQALKIQIEALEETSKNYLREDCLLWIVVLGGIAALDTPERPWYVSKLATLAHRLHSWKSVENIVERFLWLEDACGLGGRELWFEVMEFRKKEENTG